MKQSELNKFKSILRCAFCRISLKFETLHPRAYRGDFVFLMCGDCDKRYKENNNLGPKYVICLCSDIPRELDLAMAESEIDG